MDTDYLTEKAYEVLMLESGKVLGYLRSDIGASAREYPDEDSYLQGMFELLTEIAEDPINYLESWSLEEEIDCDDFHKGILDLQAKVKKVINMPLKDRGKPEFE